jgi:hypothetical protein
MRSDVTSEAESHIAKEHADDRTELNVVLVGQVAASGVTEKPKVTWDWPQAKE